MGKLSRTKGHNWERAVVQRFRAIGWPRAARTLNETRDGNCGDLENVEPLAVQVKCGAAPSPWRAITEAIDAAEPGEYPVAVIKRDRCVPLAILTLDDFMELIGQMKRTGVW